MPFENKCIKYGDDISTDLIIAGKYTKTLDFSSLAAHAMEDIDPDFHERLEKGDFVFGGENFGCGSSREHAPIAIKASGIAVVIASSFARIFYRNCINIGLPIMECPEAAAGIQAGDKVSVDFDSGEIVNETKGETYHAAAFPAFIQDIINAGGLLNSLKARGLAE